MNKSINTIREEMSARQPSGTAPIYKAGFDMGVTAKDMEWKERVRGIVQALEWYSNAHITGDIYIDGKPKTPQFEINNYAKQELEKYKKSLG